MRSILLAAFVIVTGLVLGLGWYRLVLVGGTPGPVFAALMFALVVLLAALGYSLRAHGTPAWQAVRGWWMAALFALATYVGVDLVAGWLLIVPQSPPILADPVIHHRLQPNTRFESRTDDYRYALRVNALGTRGAEVAQPKPRGTYRILMLGDSFTLGKGVDDDETFSALIGERLNRRLSPRLDLRFEIVNAGVDSYSPILSYLQLRSIAAAVAPDLVVLNLDMSDLEQDGAYRALARHDAEGAIVAIPSGEYPGEIAWSFIDRHLYVTRLLLQLVARVASAEGDTTVRDTVLTARRRVIAHTLVDDDGDRTDQWRGLFESIRAIQAYCAEAGIQFLLTTYPWGHQVGPNQWREGRQLFLEEDDLPSNRSLDTIRDRAAAAGIDLVDAFDAFREHADERLYFDRDLHWTPAGHRLMAAVLGRALEARLSGTSRSSPAAGRLLSRPAYALETDAPPARD